MIQLKQITYQYEDAHSACLNGVSWSIRSGEHWAVLGPNGSGKSTLARILAGLFIPTDGSIELDEGLESDDDAPDTLQRHIGLVFQNPDNQIVGTSLEEDVAFGPENLGIPLPELAERVESALKRVGLWERRKDSPANLSGGQKQKLAIAGILAMKPRLLIFDEATSMLDPLAAKQLMDFVISLCREENLTLINITHNMEEAVRADRVLVLSEGSVLLEGTPREIFAQRTLLEEHALEQPFEWRVLSALEEALGPVPFQPDLQAPFAWVKALPAFLASLPAERRVLTELPPPLEKTCLINALEQVLQVRQLSYRYPDSQDKRKVLQDIDFDLYQSEVLALVGHSGSGKSTLVSTLNGLLPLTEGDVQLRELSVRRKKDWPAIRRRLALIFQYPEAQIFEIKVADDIAFGPKQQAWSEDAIAAAVRQACARIGLPEKYLEANPFKLSGGQQRRVAIAGALVMDPDILVLDEPLAGLDPQGQRTLLSELLELRKIGKSIIWVTHSMADALRYADRIAVLQEGRIIALKTAEELFAIREQLPAAGLLEPPAWQFKAAALALGHNLQLASARRMLVQLLLALGCSVAEQGEEVADV